MKTLVAFALVTLLLLGTGICHRSAQAQEPQFKLVEFHMEVLKRGPKWSAHPDKDAMALHQQHVAYVHSLLESGKAIIAGPLQDDGDIRGVCIFRAKSADEARTWAMADPAISSGHLIAEMHSWWSEDVIKKPTSAQKTITAYLTFLTRGPKWTPEQTPAVVELQKAHIANIQRLAAMKKLVVAGPFGDGGNLAGIFVFRVDSLEEARALTATDPAVQAGRLAFDIHPWLVPEGALP
jgi:uncharacterized protein YciI